MEKIRYRAHGQNRPLFDFVTERSYTDDHGNMRTFADDAATNALATSPDVASLKPRPKTPHARMRIRTQNAPTFCDRSHSLIVQSETTSRAFENTISVATRPDIL